MSVQTANQTVSQSVGGVDTQNQTTTGKSGAVEADIWASILATALSSKIAWEANSTALTPETANPAGAASTDISSSYLSTGLPFSLTSEAVTRTLILLQATGSVFNEEDMALMDSRGVSQSDRQRFAEIFQDAVTQNAFADPVTYIRSLSSEDIEVIQRVHSLASSSDVTKTTKTGEAINLLLPPEQQIDLIAARTSTVTSTASTSSTGFPPTDAPQSVKDAWTETTQKMTRKDRLLAESAFLVQATSANLKHDSDGNVTGIYSPGDAGYTNIFSTDEADWSNMLSDMTQRLQSAATGSPELRQELDILNAFSTNLQKAMTSGQTETTVSLPEGYTIEKLNGHDVIISGHSADNRGNATSAGTASSLEGYSSITYKSTNSSQASGSEQNAQTAEQYRNLAKDYMQVVDIEKQLQTKYGADIKLAHSTTDSSYIMLTRQDLHYGKIKPAANDIQNLTKDMRKQGVGLYNISDIMMKYGHWGS